MKKKDSWSAHFEEVFAVTLWSGRFQRARRQPKVFLLERITKITGVLSTLTWRQNYFVADFAKRRTKLFWYQVKSFQNWIPAKCPSSCAGGQSASGDWISCSHRWVWGPVVLLDLIYILLWGDVVLLVTPDNIAVGPVVLLDLVILLFHAVVKQLLWNLWCI